MKTPESFTLSTPRDASKPTQNRTAPPLGEGGVILPLKINLARGGIQVLGRGHFSLRKSIYPRGKTPESIYMYFQAGKSMGGGTPVATVFNGRPVSCTFIPSIQCSTPRTTYVCWRVPAPPESRGTTRQHPVLPSTASISMGTCQVL